MTTDRQRELAQRSATEMERDNDEAAVMLAQLAGHDAMAELEGDDEDGDFLVASQGRSVGQLASEIEELDQEWVWPGGWIPKQLVGVFAGDAGVGKSSVLRYLIRCLTRGEQLPDGQYPEGQIPDENKKVNPMGVIVIAYEEPTKTVLLPRLREAGCDLTRVKIMSTVTPNVRKLGEPAERPFRFPEDLELLREAIMDPSLNCGLVIVDPVLSMSDKGLGHNQTVRRLLGQIQQVAIDTSVAILLVAHLTKGSNPSIRQRMNGAKAFFDFPRYVLAAAQDEGNPKRAVLWMDKHSLSPDVPSLTYERAGTSVRFVDGAVESARADFVEKDEQRTDQLILRFLAAKPTEEFTARQVSFGTRVNYDATRQQLARLTVARRITRTARGLYRMLSQTVTTEAAPQAAAPTPIVTTADALTEVLAPTTILAPSNGTRPVPMR